MGSRTVPRSLIILRKAKSYIKGGKILCKRAWARNKNNQALGHWTHENAVTFCPQAAIYKAARELKEMHWEATRAVEEEIEKQTGRERSIINWADKPEITKKDAIKLFDAAISRIEANAADRKRGVPDA